MLNYGSLLADLYQLLGVTSSTTRTDLTTAAKTAIRRANERFVNYGDWDFLAKYTDTVDIPLAAPYTTGTITVTLDSKTVTGSGTTFTKDMEGSLLIVASAEVYEIRSFVSTTSLTLSIPYQSATAAGASYAIRKRFYSLPLNFVKPVATSAMIRTPGGSNFQPIYYKEDATFNDYPNTGIPNWFAIPGNTRRFDYFNTGTVTVATTTGTSTWTISTGTLPTDIVDREVQILGETRSYQINARTGATTFTTYQTYFNPADATSVVSAATYAITPLDTKLIGFSNIPDQRYIFSMPYYRTLDDLIVSTDIPAPVRVGYEDAYITLCRALLAQDGRTSMRMDAVQTLTTAAQVAMDEAWGAECHKHNLLSKAANGPSWL